MKVVQKYLISFLVLITGITPAMDKPDEWSITQFEITKNPETQSKTYKGTYPVDTPKGLVNVRAVLYTEKPTPEVNITLDRHSLQQVIIWATLCQKIVLTHDESETDDLCKRNNWTWLPWWDDAVCHSDDLFKPSMRTKLRGNNRLTVEIRTPGTYHITIPDDADAQVQTNYGNINYKSRVPTLLEIESKTVNIWGSSGCSTEHRERWSYYRAPSHCPTQLKQNL